MCCHYLSAFRFVSHLSISAFLCVSSRAGKDTFSVGQQPSLLLTQMGKYFICFFKAYALQAGGNRSLRARAGTHPGQSQLETKSPTQTVHDFGQWEDARARQNSQREYADSTKKGVTFGVTFNFTSVVFGKASMINCVCR